VVDVEPADVDFGDTSIAPKPPHKTADFHAEVGA
jgi:hypothetical protein